jgi:integration host factor subunit alpha
MTLTKTNLVKGVREEVRLKKRKGEKQQSLFPEFDYEILSQKRATELVGAMFEIIKKSLVKGESVLITGFGKFQVKFKWARKGRNPQTGENIILDSRRIVSFQYSPKLKEKMNKPKNP